MISICTTTYRETDALEVFIKSLFINASDSDVELVIVNDEDYEPTNLLLKRFKQLYPITIIHFTRKNRIKFIRKLIKYYQENKIFETQYINEMKQTLKDYQSGKIDRLWLPTPYKFNLAATRAKGDILIFMPSDYFVFFDASTLYKKSKQILEREGRIYGHFDWYDLGSFHSYQLLNLTKDTYRDILDKVWSTGLKPVQGQHGARLVDKELFNRVGGFDDRWFVRALGEDLFNDKCGGAAFNRLLNKGEFLADHLYVGCLNSTFDRIHTYLTPSYSITPEDRWRFVNRIKEVL